jgi:thermostable 8-oxoguanine DNA glycosylase
MLIFKELFSQLTPAVVDTYNQYIQTITPVSDDDILRRWLFAFCSIHTTWENNVRSYQAIKDLSWEGDRQDLLAKLTASGAGLQNGRTNSIWAFTTRFRENPSQFYVPSTRYRERRDRLANTIHGLGLAKTSFAFELISPNTPILCLDRHVLTWLEGNQALNGNMTPKTYRRLEQRFLRACKKEGYNPIAVRHAMWSLVQNRPDMRFWSYVFEGKK